MAVAKSFVGRQFRLEFSGHRHERKGSRFLTEMRAGLATFFAMAYIISVNASITASKSPPTRSADAQTNAIFSQRRYLCL